MLNLDNIKTKNMEIKMNGKVIKVQEPTLKLVKKAQSLTNAEDLDVALGVIVEILNNNTSNVVLKVDDLEELTSLQLNALVEEIGDFINGIEEKNPN